MTGNQSLVYMKVLDFNHFVINKYLEHWNVKVRSKLVAKSVANITHQKQAAIQQTKAQKFTVLNYWKSDCSQFVKSFAKHKPN